MKISDIKPEKKKTKKKKERFFSFLKYKILF